MVSKQDDEVKGVKSKDGVYGRFAWTAKGLCSLLRGLAVAGG